MNSLRAIGEKDGSIAAIAGWGDHFCGQKMANFFPSQLSLQLFFFPINTLLVELD